MREALALSVLARVDQIVYTVHCQVENQIVIDRFKDPDT
jgi:hypothetical protein